VVDVGSAASGQWPARAGFGGGEDGRSMERAVEESKPNQLVDLSWPLDR
jgi:hypothetical protein